MTTVQWFDNSSVENAISRARELQRPILIDLWHPTCLGCAKLFATTYTDPAVRAVIADEFVCVKYDTTRPNIWFRRLNGTIAHVWHPHILVADHRLTEGARFVGYLRPDQFIARLRLAAGVLHMYHRRFAEAHDTFAAASDPSLPRNTIAEALYWQGVAAYRVSGSIAQLKPFWERLVTEFTDTDWAARADCLDVEIPESGFDPHDLATVRITSGANVA